jgi:hypothetical protein
LCDQWWRLGPAKSVDRILTLLRYAGNTLVDFEPIRNVKLSRVAVCLDILLPSHFWSIDVIDNIVCRAKDIKPYLRNGQMNSMTGFRIAAAIFLLAFMTRGLRSKTNRKSSECSISGNLSPFPKASKPFSVVSFNSFFRSTG